MSERRRIAEISPKALSLFSAAFILALILPAGIHAATLQASWNPNMEPDLKGYKIYYGTAPGNYVASIDVGNVIRYELIGLQNGTTYYITLTAYDASLNESNFSPEVSVTLNRPPHSPGQPSPLGGAMGVALLPTLTWTGGDPDPEDTVAYDVYLGQSNPPSLVRQNRAGTAFSPGTLRPATTYLWQIVGRDNHGMETYGPIWSFTTLDSGALFPTASLFLNQTSFRKGELLILDIHLTAPAAVPPGGGYPIELKIWLQTPLEPPMDRISLLDIAGPQNSITLSPGFDQTFPFMRGPVPSDILPGTYGFGIRLRNPVTNEEFSVDTQPFSVIGP